MAPCCWVIAVPTLAACCRLRKAARSPCAFSSTLSFDASCVVRKSARRRERSRADWTLNVWNAWTVLFTTLCAVLGSCATKATSMTSVPSRRATRSPTTSASMDASRDRIPSSTVSTAGRERATN